jgi:hypothetical protein
MRYNVLYCTVLAVAAQLRASGSSSCLYIVTVFKRPSPLKSYLEGRIISLVDHCLLCLVVTQKLMHASFTHVASK